MQENNDKNYISTEELYDSCREEVDEALRKCVERTYNVKLITNDEKKYEETWWYDFDAYINYFLKYEESKNAKNIFSTFYNETLKKVPYNVKKRMMTYLDGIARRSEHGYWDMNNRIFCDYFVINLSKLLKGDFKSEKLIDLAYVITKENKYASEILSKVVNSKRLKDAGLTDSFLTGLLNAPLFERLNYGLLSYIEEVLNADDYKYGGLNVEIANYYLVCPSFEHCEAISSLVNKSESSLSSEFVLEFLDEIINTDKEKLDELVFHILNRSVKKEVTFAEACKNFTDQAMEILKTNTSITPNTIVTITDYESEFLVFPKFGKEWSLQRKI